MSEPLHDRLYDLLPAVYRVRDRAQGQPLRALLGVVEEEFERLEVDVARLYDNWFVETCDDWVVPYIGDLLGVTGLLDVGEGVFTQRGLVANTLAYRRAKGTAAVLEQLARDVTGWPAKAVEFFDRLATTRATNHERRSDVSLVEVRDANADELVGGPFERAAHLADVRHVSSGRGKYNIPNVGLYLWRLQDYDVTWSTARAVPGDPGRFTFSPLGDDAPLFNVPRPEDELTQLAGEANVPGPLRRRPLRDELDARRQTIVDGGDVGGVYFGEPARPGPHGEPGESNAVLRVAVAGRRGDLKEVPPEEIVICNLTESPRDGTWKRPPKKLRYRPSAGGRLRDRRITAGVDPVLGRLVFPEGVTPERVEVSFAYGFSGDLGGGPYDRTATVAQELEQLGDEVWQVGVTRTATSANPELVTTIGAALDAWTRCDEASGVIALMDSRTYEEDLTIVVPAGKRLLVVAADWPFDEEPDELGVLRRSPGRLTPKERRPHLRGRVDLQGAGPAGRPAGELTLDGLLVEGGVTVLAGDLGLLRLAHSTVVPRIGHLSVGAEDADGRRNERLAVVLERSICGRIDLAGFVPRLTVAASIVDEGAAAIEARSSDVAVTASTVLGPTRVRTLNATDTIFAGPVEVERRQRGCVRYCYVSLDSRVPQRFRCQPASAAEAERVAPDFASVTYGRPAYCQLARSCPDEILRGGEGERELGAFNFLAQPQRIANLNARLDEYLRFGLEAGVFFVT